MSSSSILDESSGSRDTPLITVDDSYSDWEMITNGSEPKSPEPNEPPQSPLHSVTLALAEIRGLFADPVTDSPLPCESPETYAEPTVPPEVIKKPYKEFESTIKGFDEPIEHSVAPDMRNLTSSVDSIRKDTEANLVESELCKIRRSHLRKAIKELEIANSSLLASITHEDDPKAEDEPKLARKRQRPGPPPKKKPNTAAYSKSRKLEELSPGLSQADQHESFSALTTAQSPPPIFAPPKNSIACRFRAVGLYFDPEPKPEEVS
jgi:hypothetical protein